MMPVVGADLSKRLVPDELWELAAPLLPSFAARPQGGGTAPCDERAVFTPVVYALTSGCAWRLCRRRSARRPPPRIAASRYGPRPASGVGCTGRYWTNRGPGRGGPDLGDR
ncbi:transposase [Streptomyces sp. P9(2023)]|uniref:transposase n=1 Tax=Streptomyces sp. P9(2023) TaxID=3064394 RepID=UPI0037DD410C